MDKPDIVIAACSRAWSVYLLINNGIDANDARRAELESFIRQRWEAVGFEKGRRSCLCSQSQLD